MPIRYDTYAATISTIVIIFCAAQAPELFGRDQRHGVLALYFARALRRSDYALARIAGFMAALLILQLLPQIVLFLGRVLLTADIPQAVGDDLPSVGPVLAQSALSAALLGGLSMTVSAFTPRRAYAVAGIIALFVLPNVVAGVVVGLGSSTIGTWLTLLSPTSVLDGTNAFLFDTRLDSEFFFVDLPGIAFVGRGGGRDARLGRDHGPPVRADHGMTTPQSFAELPSVGAGQGGPAAALVLERVSRWYGNVVAVNDITFALGPGITGLLGPNGAGKTTILHMLAGLLRPSAGRVSVGGQPAWRNPAVYRSVGLVPEREAVHDVPDRAGIRRDGRPPPAPAGPALRPPPGRSRRWTSRPPPTVRSAPTPRACASG